MIPPRRDCELLRPALVALLFEEPHPEAEKLRVHLRGCPACRGEEQALRETRERIEAAGRLPVEVPAAPLRRGSRRAGPPLVSHAALAVAVLFVVCLLFLSGRRAVGPAPAARASREGGDRAASAGGRRVGAREELASAAGDWASSFAADDLDGRIDLVERELASAREDLW